MLELDICGETLPLADEQVDWLIARARRDAGGSARHRDLADLGRHRFRPGAVARVAAIALIRSTRSWARRSRAFASSSPKTIVRQPGIIVATNSMRSSSVIAASIFSIIGTIIARMPSGFIIRPIRSVIAFISATSLPVVGLRSPTR